MKKALLIGAVVSSMALSSVAFAAVDYNQTWPTDMSYNYDKATGVLTLVNPVKSASATTDTTIVVVNGENTNTIDQSNIMYIDQAADPTTYGNMGLLFAAEPQAGEKATLLYNDGSAAIYGATFELKEAKNVPEYVTVKWGDVDGSGAPDTSDALAILAGMGGKVNDGPFTIGTPIKVVDLETETVADADYKWGDVDCSGAPDTSDALAILAGMGGKVNDGDYVIGTSIGAYAK